MKRIILALVIIVVWYPLISDAKSPDAVSPGSSPAKPSTSTVGPATDLRLVRPVIKPIYVCGDGTVSTVAGEQCDPPGSMCASGATCSSDCKCSSAAPMCGDGVVNTASGEQCDPTADPAQFPNHGCQEGYTCNTSCLCIPPVNSYCGDGILSSPQEQCDPMSNTPNYGCSTGQICNASCECISPVDVESVCGNGVVESGENCDPPGKTGCEHIYSAYVCHPDCRCFRKNCGDGIRMDNEECDPGNPMIQGCPEGTVCTQECTCMPLIKKRTIRVIK